MQIFNQLVTAVTKAREVLAQKIESFKAQQGRAVVGSWTDDTGAIFERRQDGSFTDLSGNAYTPTGTPLPYGGAGGGTATVSGNIAKETGGHLQSIDASLAVPLPLPTNAAKETGGNLDAIAASTLATEQSTAAIEQVFASPLNTRALTKATDSVSVEVTNTAAIKTDSSETTQPVSMAEAAPLSPNAAQEDTLQSLSAKLDDGSQKTQVTNFPATQAVNGLSLDAIAAALGTTADTAFVEGSANGNAIQLLKAVTAYLAGTLDVQLAEIPLADNAATEATQKNVLKALQKSSSSVWVDDTGTCYIQRQIVDEATGDTTVEYTDAYGNPATPGAGLKPSSSSSTLSESQYECVAVNETAEYAVGDVLLQTTVYDVSTSPATLVMVTWLNVNTGTTLTSAPPAGDTEKQGSNVTVKNAILDVQAPNGLPLPAGAATETSAQALLSNTASLGAVGDSPWAGSGNGSQVAILKALFGVLNFISSQQTDGTQKVALPANASKETGGNLDAIKTASESTAQTAATVSQDLASLLAAFGSKSDAVYGGTGDASAESLLKGIYALLAVIESRTATEPALETGNLLKAATALGEPTDAAWSGTGSGSQIAILKRINAALNSEARVFKGTPVTVVAASTQNIAIAQGAARISIINTGTVDCQLKGASASQAGTLMAGYGYTIDCPSSGILEAYTLTVPTGGTLWYLIQQ